MRLFLLAFGAVILQAWMGRRGSPNWYLSCIVPLLYGASVAWLFVDEDLVRSLWIILFGAAIPITLLVSAWLRRRGEEPDGGGEESRTGP